MDVTKVFEDMIEDTLARLGGELVETKEAVALYAAQRSERLALIIESGEPGFDQAVIAARDNVALMAGLKVGDDIDAAGFEWLGLIAAGLRFAALVLVGGGGAT